MTTKEQLIEMLKNDNSSMDTLINIYLECTNNDCGMGSESKIKLSFNERTGILFLEGEYEESEY